MATELICESRVNFHSYSFHLQVVERDTISYIIVTLEDISRHISHLQRTFRILQGREHAVAKLSSFDEHAADQFIKSSQFAFGLSEHLNAALEQAYIQRTNSPMNRSAEPVSAYSRAKASSFSTNSQ